MIRCSATLIRMLTNQEDAVLIAAPTGVAGFQARGATWHTKLSIPTGKAALRSFETQGGDRRIQNRLAHVHHGAVIGDEISMVGRTLFGWIGNTLRLNVDRGAGSNVPLGGDSLPFFVQAGDFHQLPPVFDTVLYDDSSRNANSNCGRMLFKMFDDVVLLTQVVRQSETEVKLRALIENMRLGADPGAYDFAFVKSRRLDELGNAERARFVLPNQGTLYCAPSWEKAHLRNKTVLGMINKGWEDPKRGTVDAAPIYKVNAHNQGRHARAKAHAFFAGLPPAAYIGIGVQLRLTCNMFGPVGQSWGLVNGEIGTCVDVIFDENTPPSDIDAGKALPSVVLHLKSYKGPRFYVLDPTIMWRPVADGKEPTGRDVHTLNVALAAYVASRLQAGLRPEEAELQKRRTRRYEFAYGDHVTAADGARYQLVDPKLVILPPMTSRSRDCSCPCARTAPPLRVAESTSIHSLQGITVGEGMQVERLGIDFGEAVFETRNSGLSQVAQSRPQSERDFCYTKPVDLERLAACGKGAGADALRVADAEFEAKALASDARLFHRADFDALLAWATAHARDTHGIVPSWARPPPL